MMKKLTAVVITGLALMTGCANAPAEQPGDAAPPQATLADAQESLCGHIIDDFAPSFESVPAPFDKDAAATWAGLSVLFEADAAMFQQAGESALATKVQGLAQAADDMRAAIDQPGELTSDGLVESMDAVAKAAQDVGDRVEAVVDAIGQEVCVNHDAVAQASLRNALVAAKVFYTDSSTYAGFDPEVAVGIEPSITFAGDEPAAEEVVSINLVDGDQVVLSTMSGNGQAFCIADSVVSGQTVYGSVDAHGATDITDCGTTDDDW